MKRITLILTYAQADRLLNNLPAGHQVKVSVADLNKIIATTNISNVKSK